MANRLPTGALAGITIADHQRDGAQIWKRCANGATGAGQLVDVAMYDVLTASVWDEPVDHYAAIGMPPRTGNADGRGAPINTYRCADGWISVTCTSDRQWQLLCDLMARDDVLERWPTIRERAAAASDIDAAVEAWTKSRPVQEVETAFLQIGMPAGRVRDPIEAATDPRLRARGLPHRTPPSGRPADRPSGFLGPSLPIAFAGRVDLPPAEMLGGSTDVAARPRGLRRRRPRGDCAPMRSYCMSSGAAPTGCALARSRTGIWRPGTHATQLLADLGGRVEAGTAASTIRCARSPTSSRRLATQGKRRRRPADDRRPRALELAAR
jgi:crotonobetainyl-CoA:carnitine CoA-transferase CaiB-like acyl-CoA transferase